MYNYVRVCHVIQNEKFICIIFKLIFLLLDSAIQLFNSTSNMHVYVYRYHMHQLKLHVLIYSHAAARLSM